MPEYIKTVIEKQKGIMKVFENVKGHEPYPHQDSVRELDMPEFW